MPWISSSDLWRLKQGNIEYHIVNDALVSLQQAILNQTERITKMTTAIDDLTAAVTKVQDAVTAAVADIKAQAAQIQQANSQNNDPAIEDAATKLNAIADTLNQAVSPPVPPA